MFRSTTDARNAVQHSLDTHAVFQEFAEHNRLLMLHGYERAIEFSELPISNGIA
jgi:hypothetical protein